MTTTAADVRGLSSRLERIPSATLFDVLDARGLGDRCVLSLQIRPLVPGRQLAGPAHTVRWVRDPRRPEEFPDRPVDAPPISPLFRQLVPGGVIVVDPSGDRACGHWGEMLSMMAQRFGARGAVVDGGTRDSAGIRALDDWAVYTRYTSPIESISRVRIREVGVPLALDGALGGPIRIDPGDWMCADDDAVIVVPAGIVVDILRECEALEQVEEGSRAALVAGEDPDEVFRRYRRG